jgi:hypothetical protein
MARFAFVLQTVLTLALVGAAGRPVMSQTTPAKPISKVYSLADLSDDPGLGPWIAETIAAVIEPETWKQGSSPCGSVGARPDDQFTLRYYAPRRILVVYHTPAVHEKVKAFLSEVRKNQPQAAASAPVACAHSHEAGCCVQAGCKTIAPAVSLTYSSTAANSAGYPVPSPAQQPKHLFHFVIRYEGPGDVDENVVKALQQACGKKADDDSDKKDEASETKEKDDKAAALPPGQLPKHLLHFVIRYEGAGIIDDNVVKAMRLYSGKDEEKSAKSEDGGSDECEDK